MSKPKAKKSTNVAPIQVPEEPMIKIPYYKITDALKDGRTIMALVPNCETLIWTYPDRYWQGEWRKVKWRVYKPSHFKKEIRSCWVDAETLEPVEKPYCYRDTLPGCVRAI